MMRTFLGSFLLLLALASGAGGAPAVSSAPISIKSNELHADNDKKTAVFEGKVVARQADLTLYADRLVITYASQGGDLNRVEAFGNVRIVQGKRQAFGAHATYENKSGKIVLDGNPRVLQGDDEVTGEVITYYVDEQRSVVTGGGSSRVNAVIHPGSKDGLQR